MAVKKKYGTLGRGLDALIDTEEVNTDGSSTINEIDLSLIDVNPNQPRREFDEEALQELADSIAEIGIIQPITLRQQPDGRYQIIAGERRWRAAGRAGLKTIPAYIRTVDDENMMEMALIENIQRQDLNSIEIALAYQHLIEQYHLTQERVSDRVGKKRATVANYLRLLKLPAPVQVALQNHQIDAGHARALLALDDPKLQIRLFREILQKQYSVRQVEQIIRNLLEKPADGKPAAKSTAKLPQEVEAWMEVQKNRLHADVRITANAKGSGKLTIAFSDADDLRRLMSLLEK